MSSNKRLKSIKLNFFLNRSLNISRVNRHFNIYLHKLFPYYFYMLNKPGRKIKLGAALGLIQTFSVHPLSAIQPQLCNK